MDLEVVGRHALLFDDDAAASFINSGDALVDWHSLQIDRYDVRHLLSAPPPARRRSGNSQPLIFNDPSLESQLDHERYLDLPSPSDQPELEENGKPMNNGGYCAVAFSYGNTSDSADQRNADAQLESSKFCPSIPVPESLSQSLPPTEKLHQIIARTAMFVSRHGGQSEIILRVKQGDNPTFGFLMPDHHLHPYFRFLVDHQDLLHSDVDGNFQNEGKKAGGEHNNAENIGGALSLLGTVYESGEEEDGDDGTETGKYVPTETTSAVNLTTSRSSEKTESIADGADKDEALTKRALSNKAKVLAVRKSSLISASKAGSARSTKKKVDSGSFSTAAEKSKDSAFGVTSNIEPIVLEPPSDLKRLIDKIAEFIMRNGNKFAETLIEQDRNRERFPFLLPSNQYHPYYLKVLQKAQESKGFNFRKDDPVGRGMEEKASILKEADSSSLGCDTPFEIDRKEKFKMVIGKSKKDAQETQCTGSQQEFGVTVDAAAAAAILQAAARGIKNPKLGIISSTSGNTNPDPSREAKQVTTLVRVPSGQLHCSVEKTGQSSGNNNISIPVTKKIARTASLEAAGEADSSKEHLTKEQKLKAERLKRAKMFVTMLKSGSVPFKTETQRASSLEPEESGPLRSVDKVNLTGKEREDSLAPVDVDMPATGEKAGRNNYFEEHNEPPSRKYRSRSGGHKDGDEREEDDSGEKMGQNERRSRRKYRSRSERHQDDEDENGEERELKRSRKNPRPDSSSQEDEEKSEEDKDHKHSKRKHRSRSSPHEDDDYEDRDREGKDHNRSRKKHLSHHSSQGHSRKRHSVKKYSRDEEDEDYEEGREHRRSRKKHRSHRSSNHSRGSHRHTKRRHSSRETESQHDHKNDGSSDSEHQHGNKSGKHKRESSIRRQELEEGEISSKASDESRGIAGRQVSRETSLDVSSSHQRAPSQPSETTTEVSDDLRAKIRAMLMATRM